MERHIIGPSTRSCEDPEYARANRGAQQYQRTLFDTDHLLFREAVHSLIEQEVEPHPGHEQAGR